MPIAIKAVCPQKQYSYDKASNPHKIHSEQRIFFPQKYWKCAQNVAPINRYSFSVKEFRTFNVTKLASNDPDLRSPFQHRAERSQQLIAQFKMSGGKARIFEHQPFAQTVRKRSCRLLKLQAVIKLPGGHCYHGNTHQRQRISFQ